jgi:hypothetical protein
LKDLNFGPDSYGFVVSPTGRFISHPDQRFGILRALTDVPGLPDDEGLASLVGRVLGREAGEARATDFASGRPARFLFAPVLSPGWSVVAVIPGADGSDPP